MCITTSSLLNASCRNWSFTSLGPCGTPSVWASPAQIPQRRVDHWSGWRQEVSSHLRSSGPTTDRPEQDIMWLCLYETWGVKRYSWGWGRFTCTNIVSGLQASIVSDVFSQRLFSIDVFSVDSVAVVLIHHTLRSLPKRIHRWVLPPRPEVPLLIVLSPWSESDVSQLYMNILDYYPFYLSRTSVQTHPGHRRRVWAHDPSPPRCRQSSMPWRTKIF